MLGYIATKWVRIASLLWSITCIYRLSKVTGTPYLGRVVRLISGLMLAFGVRFNLNLWVVMAKINTASIMAKLLPKHSLGPPPKGM